MQRPGYETLFPITFLPSSMLLLLRPHGYLFGDLYFITGGFARQRAWGCGEEYETETGIRNNWHEGSAEKSGIWYKQKHRLNRHHMIPILVG